jgi:hypothetical protein
MIALTLKLDGDRAWPDLGTKTERGLVAEAGAIEVVGLAGGMTSGDPSVAIRLDLPDGRVAIAQTSLAMLLMAADALRARYGNPRADRP